MFFTILSVGFMILIVSTIVLSILTISRDQSLIRLSSSNISGLPTILYQSFGTIDNASLSPESVDVAGSVVGSLTAPGIYEVIIRFSSPYSPPPKSVMLTPATPSSGLPVTGTILTVDNITSTQFEMFGYSPSSLPLGTLFYYTVI